MSRRITDVSNLVEAIENRMISVDSVGGMKNIYMEEYYRVECSVYDGVSAKEVDRKLRETIFDKMDWRNI